MKRTLRELMAGGNQRFRRKAALWNRLAEKVVGLSASCTLSMQTDEAAFSFNEKRRTRVVPRESKLLAPYLSKVWGVFYLNFFILSIKEGVA